MSALIMYLLAPVILGFFISGLLKRRHDWKPLVLGLFALGLGALATAWDLHDSLSAGAACTGPVGVADICDAAAKALTYLVCALIIALAGGLFTVILRWRNAPRNDSDADEASELETEIVDGGDA
jgi:hypothetical protein